MVKESEHGDNVSMVGKWAWQESEQGGKVSMVNKWAWWKKMNLLKKWACRKSEFGEKWADDPNIPF